MPLRISTTIGDSLVIDRVFRSPVITVRDVDTQVDHFLDIVDFDMILGIDWLSHYHVILDCLPRVLP